MNRPLPESEPKKFALILMYLLVGCGLTLCTLAIPVSYLPGETSLSALVFGKPMTFVVQDQSNRPSYSREFEMPPYPAFPLKLSGAQKTRISPIPFLANVVFWSLVSFLILQIEKAFIRWITRFWKSEVNERTIT